MLSYKSIVSSLVAANIYTTAAPHARSLNHSLNRTQSIYRPPFGIKPLLDGVIWLARVTWGANASLYGIPLLAYRSMGEQVDDEDERKGPVLFIESYLISALQITVYSAPPHLSPHYFLAKNPFNYP